MSGSDIYASADFTRFYDWSYIGARADVAFCVELARRYGGPVLEIACGTGRVALSVARAGWEVVGVDRSAPMLAIARDKLSREPADVRRRVSLVAGDMRRFDLKRRFPLVLVPNASLFHLRDPAALSDCFSCLYAHTADGGAVMIDVVAPAAMANQSVGTEQLIAEGTNPATGRWTREFNRKLRIDRDNRIVSVEHVYTEQDGPSETRLVFHQEYRWLEEAEGRALLDHAGYCCVEAFGDYDGTRYTPDAPRLIITATRDNARNG